MLKKRKFDSTFYAHVKNPKFSDEALLKEKVEQEYQR